MCVGVGDANEAAEYGNIMQGERSIIALGARVVKHGKKQQHVRRVKWPWIVRQIYCFVLIIGVCWPLVGVKASKFFIVAACGHMLPDGTLE